MAVLEKTVLMQSVDELGSPVLFYPATRAEAVYGLTDMVQTLIDSQLGELDAILDAINGQEV